MAGITSDCTFKTDLYAVLIKSIEGADSKTGRPIERHTIVHAHIADQLSCPFIIGTDQYSRFQLIADSTTQPLRMDGGDGAFEVLFLPWHRLQQRIQMRAVKINDYEETARRNHTTLQDTIYRDVAAIEYQPLPNHLLSGAPTRG